MVATIRESDKGVNNSRLVENIVNWPPADGPLADMLLTDDPARLDALAKEAAAAIGHAAAAGRPIVSLTGINVAAARSRVTSRGGFADELYHLSSKEMRKKQGELSAQAIKAAEARINALLAEKGSKAALRQCLTYIAEDDLGFFSDVDLDAEIPPFVARAGFEGDEGDELIRHLLASGRQGRNYREANAARTHQAAYAERLAERLARKKAGLSCFATYAINPVTGRAVPDEEFEATEIAGVEAEIIEAAVKSGAGNIAIAVKKGTDLGSILVEVFVAACRTRDLPVDVEGMIASFVEAAGDMGLAGLFERTTAAARACAGPVDTEAAFSRLLAAEGIAAPFTFAPEAPAEPAQALAEVEAPSAPIEVPATPAAVPVDETADPEASIDLRPRPLSALTRPPGLVGGIVDYIEASAEFPSRELALGAALGFVAALAGRGYETPRQARTNLYIVCLAPSGFGKDHAPSCINALARACDKSRFLGPARFMSSSALRNEVMAQPSMLAIQDEYGGILRQIDGPKVGIHNEMIRYDLLGFFSRAKDEFAGAAYASARAVKIHNPNLCVLGLSTPDDFWSALSSSRSQDGYLGRYILINVEGKKPPRTKPTMSLRAPPQELIDGCNAIHHAVYASRGNLRDTMDGSSPFDAEVVDFSRDAEEVLEALEIKIGHAAERADFKVAPFWQRAYEHAVKIALTVAVGVDPVRPIITAEIMSWAADLAWASVCALCREAENRMADNERQRSFNRIIEIVRRAGANGLPLGKLTDKLGGTLDKRLRLELIEEATETGRILSIFFEPSAGTGRKGFRFVAPEFRPNDAG